MSSAMVASVESRVRSPGIVPSEMIATGVVGGRPPSTRRAAICGRFCTAISSTTVPRSAASASQATSESGWSGGRWPETTVNSWATPRCVTGMPATAGTEIALVRPGIDGPRHARLLAGQRLLEAAAVDERVAALEAHHPLAGQRPVDDDAVDLLLRGGPAAGQLGHVDQLHVRRQLVEQLARGEPVGHHHVGLAQRSARRHGDQLGVTRAAADEHDARRTVVVVRGDDLTVPQRGDDPVADRGRLARLAVAEHRDGHAGVPADRRASRRVACGRVVGADAEDPLRLAGRADLLVDTGVVGRGDDVPRLVDVARLEAALVPGDLAGAGQALDRGGRHRRNDHDVGTGREKSRDPALGDVPAADDEHPAALEPEARGVRREVFVHSDSLRVTPAESKVAISRSRAPAASTRGNDRTAPVPSPSRRSRSTSGRSPSWSSATT